VADREVRLSRVLQGRDDHVAGVGVEVGRDLAVEVRRQAVADVGLDQALVPVARRGVGVEGVDRRLERRHRVEGVGAERPDPLVEPTHVPELQGGHARHLHLVAQRRREPGVVDETLERRQLAVGDHAQKVDDGEAVVGVVEHDGSGVLRMEVGGPGW
jgi:hypothetical protein